MVREVRQRGLRLDPVNRRSAPSPPQLRICGTENGYGAPSWPWLKQASVAVVTPLTIAGRAHAVCTLIDRHALFGRGISYVDAHLLAAARLTSGSRLWTRDRRLQTLAIELGLAAALSH